MKTRLLLSATLLVAACKASTPAPATTAPAPAAVVASPTAALNEADRVAMANPPPAETFAKADFTDKVWKVSGSNAVQAGSTYTFLRDGTLVVDSPAGNPMYGSWTYAGGRLAMTEEGMTYPTDILQLDAGTFRIRSHNPGEAVDITLVPAPDAALPPATPATTK